MARIRTIKPEFFRHEGLYEAEIESGLPLRVAFAALWTVADREGRFKWRPRELKLDCLPYDDVDFSRVLDALGTRGLIVQYEVDGESLGWIPTFSKHQVVNTRERASALPPPNNTNKDNTLTREAPVEVAGRTRHQTAKRGMGTGKGTGKGKRERSACGTTLSEGAIDSKTSVAHTDQDCRRLDARRS
jgi:hypothetical protein